LIDEQEVFNRFHNALDVEPQPGAFDRLEAALTQRPVTSSRRTWFALPVPRMGLRLTAALIAVLLTLAVASALLAHLTTSRTTPAKPSTTTLTGQLHDGSPRMVTPKTGWSCSCLDLSSLSRTTDGGATWRSVQPPPVGGIGSVRSWYFLDAEHAWIAAVVSGTSLTVFATADGGRTWTAGTPVPAGFGGDIPFMSRPGSGNQLDFLDDRVGWLRTSSGLGQHTLTLYSTTDGGRTWRLILKAADADGSTLARLGRGCYEDDLRFVSRNLGWISYNCVVAQAAGQPGSGSPAPGPEVAVTKDGGRSWQQVLLPRFTTDYNRCITTAPIFYNSSQEILTAGCYNSSQVSGGVNTSDWRAGIYVTSDAGLSWSLRPTPPRGGIPAFSDVKNGWSHVWPGAKGGWDMFRTSDGGLTWKLTGSFPGDDPTGPGTLQVFDSNVAIVTTQVMSPHWLTDWKTTDGGRTWVGVKRPPPLLD
jgi:hypothetical protein